MLQMNFYKPIKIIIMKTNQVLNGLSIGVLSLALLSCASAEKPNTQKQEVETTEEVTEIAQKQEPKTEVKPMEYVVIETNKGDIKVELYASKAPITVANFLSYVDAGFYDGTIFHRVISNFMIQGGGFTTDGTKKDTKAPIVLESQTGLSNAVGTIAMARTSSPNSATAQFFINVADNANLDYRPGSPGYAVFGKVISGMDVVNEIRQVKTGSHDGRADWPIEPVVIETIKRQ